MPVPTSNQGAESKRWLVPLLANLRTGCPSAVPSIRGVRRGGRRTSSWAAASVGRRASPGEASMSRARWLPLYRCIFGRTTSPNRASESPRAARSVRDPTIYVHEGGPRRAADLRACGQGAARGRGPALSSLPHDAPPGHQARAPARPPPRGARARRTRTSARERQLAPDRARVDVWRGPCHRVLASPYFCTRSPAGQSGSPCLGSASATNEKRRWSRFTPSPLARIWAVVAGTRLGESLCLRRCAGRDRSDPPGLAVACRSTRHAPSARWRVSLVVVQRIGRAYDAQRWEGPRSYPISRHDGPP